MMCAPKAANLALRFLLECACVASVAWFGLSLEGPDSLRYFTAFALAVILVMIWGAFGSPKAPLRLQGAGLLLLELAMYGVAAAALVLSGSPFMALLLVVAASISTMLHRQ